MINCRNVLRPEYIDVIKVCYVIDCMSYGPEPWLHMLVVSILYAYK